VAYCHFSLPVPVRRIPGTAPHRRPDNAAHMPGIPAVPCPIAALLRLGSASLRLDPLVSWPLLCECGAANLGSSADDGAAGTRLTVSVVGLAGQRARLARPRNYVDVIF